MRALPRPIPEYFALGGGLDLVTPAMMVPPGRLFDSQNYEPHISGGYRRIDGYERFDGRASPSSRSYWMLAATLSAAVAVGALVTGAVSGATGRVLALYTGGLVLGALTGSFNAGEGLTVSGLPVGAVVTEQAEQGAASVSDHADYRHLAANLQRTLIQPVPGSGPIRGVWVYKDTVYAVRNNAGGTASVIHKATPTGWQAITLGTSLRFDAATAEINLGETVTNQAGTASGVVVSRHLTTGTWTSAGVGSLVLSTTTGTFSDNDQIRVGGVQRATANGASAAIARAPGGRVETVNANFTGSADAEKVYGADGVNPAFEFDGTIYAPILTGMAEDKPLHITEHKGHLFLSFRGSVQHSAIGNPYSWSVVLGAGEIATGAVVTGFLTQSGSDTSAALAIATRKNVFTLYGNNSAEWQLIPGKDKVGFSDYTLQQAPNDAFGMTDNGIQSMRATQSFGNFAFSSISHLIEPLVTSLQGKEIASTTIRRKGQYRVYFSTGECIVVGLTGDKVTGLTRLDYRRPVRCVVTDTLTTGEEVTFFGSDDGYVYQDNKGTSQDGETIQAWCRLPFNTMKTPLVRKRYLRAVMDVKVDGYAEVAFSYDLGFGNPGVSPSAPESPRQMFGSGGFWDSATWDRFNWDSAMVTQEKLPMDGTENNLSYLFYSNRAQDASHTLQGVTVVYIPRRLDR